MFHAPCKIQNIVRKFFFRYNSLLICMTIGKKCSPLIFNLYLTFGVFLSVNFGNHRAAPITWDPIADSPDKMTTIVLSSAEQKYRFQFLFILVFWRLFRNNFPRYTVIYDFQRKINILMKFPNGSIVFHNAATRNFVANSWHYDPAKWLSIRAHAKIPYFETW